MGEIENKQLSKIDGQDEGEELKEELEDEKMKIRLNERESKREREIERERERERGSRNMTEIEDQNKGYQGQQQVGEHLSGEDMEEGEERA